MISPYQAKKFAEENGIPVADHLREWISYANTKAIELEILIDEAREHQKQTEDADAYLVLECLAASYYLDLHDLRTGIAKAKELINPPKRIYADRITDEDIARAKDYPVDQLITFTKGKALAFCHPDKTPSLSHNRAKNFCHCFVCNKTFNAIDILIYRDNMPFIQAVKSLCGRF